MTECTQETGYLQSINSDKHLSQSPFTGKFFRWRHFALTSMSIIILWLLPLSPVLAGSHGTKLCLLSFQVSLQILGFTVFKKIQNTSATWSCIYYVYTGILQQSIFHFHLRFCIKSDRHCFCNKFETYKSPFYKYSLRENTTNGS